MWNHLGSVPSEVAQQVAVYVAPDLTDQSSPPTIRQINFFFHLRFLPPTISSNKVRFSHRSYHLWLAQGDERTEKISPVVDGEDWCGISCCRGNPIYGGSWSNHHRLNDKTGFHTR